MVSYAPLWEIISAYLLRAVPGSDLALSGLRFGVVALLAFQVIKLCTQQCKCLILILKL